MRRSSRWSVLREPTVPFLLAACVVHVVRRDAVDFSVFFGTAVVIVIDAGRPRGDDGAASTADGRGIGSVGRRLHAWPIGAGMTAFAAVVALAGPASLGARLVVIAIGLAAVAVVLLRPRVRRSRSGESTVGLTGAAGVASAGGVTASAGSAGDGAAPFADADPPADVATGLASAAAARGPGALRAPETPARKSRLGAARGWPVWAALGLAACLWELTSFIAQQVWPTDQADHPAASDLIGPLLTAWPGRAVFLLLWACAGWWLLRRLHGSRPDTGSVGSGGAAAGRGDGARPGSGLGRRSYVCQVVVGVGFVWLRTR